MATSKREEERNEKIIRGLMKLPPNRRCINCNSLGPQYVCTNFWTFVCMICSGIHREFTHRVKSVSMSKFTSQEVEALQNGGNQRAREIFLKDWDLQKLPNSSNAHKVREFIKAVYVDRKYVGGNNSEKPPRDMKSHSSGDDIRRASSYHSYSQSPPYDFQYEERVKRNQGGSHGRKSGFDRGIYERKAASFMYSPGRFSDHIYEDRFTKAGSSSRVSDYSVSSGGDPFTPGPQSPNLQKDDGLFNPNIDSQKELDDDASQIPNKSLNPEVNAKKDSNTIPLPHPQRSVSSGSFGSSDSCSTSLQGCFDTFSEPNQSSAATQNEVSLFPSISQPPTENFASLNLFEETLGMPTSYSAPDVSFSQAPAAGTSPSIDLFQPFSDSSAMSPKFQNHETSVSPSFSNSHEPSKKPVAANINQKLSEPSQPCDEGWATFDLPQAGASIASTQSAFVSTVHSEGWASFTNTNSVPMSKVEMEWANFQALETPSVLSNPWNEGVQNAHAHTDTLSGQPWKAFEEYNQHLSEKKEQGAAPQVSLPKPSSATDKDLDVENPEGFIVDGFKKVILSEEASFPSSVSHFVGGSSFSPPIGPLMGEIAQAGPKPGNPFDVDSELEANNAFLGVSTLQAVLPSMPLPSYDEPWFSSNPIAYQGGLSYPPVQAPSSQLPNIQAPGAVASSSGNPFA